MNSERKGYIIVDIRVLNKIIISDIYSILL